MITLTDVIEAAKMLQTFKNDLPDIMGESIDDIVYEVKQTIRDKKAGIEVTQETINNLAQEINDMCEEEGYPLLIKTDES